MTQDGNLRRIAGSSTLTVSQKLFWAVTPANAGVQDILKKLDSG
jgi:hypothetical protein